MNAVERYILDHSSPEDALLCELERETHRRAVHPHMLSGPTQGKFLELLVRMLKPRRVLEIGTFTGYSALCMAAGLDGEASIDTIEANDELETLARSFFDRSPHGHRIRLHIGSALEVVPRLGDVYDLVFIDGDKREYPAYYRMLMNGNAGRKTAPGMRESEVPPDGGRTPERNADPKKSRSFVRSGSFVLADNILWYGKAAEPEKHTDPMTTAINEFNRMVRDDDRVENVILPIRDGLNLIRVK